MFPLGHFPYGLFGLGFFPPAQAPLSGARGPYFGIRHFPLGVFAIGYFPEAVGIVPSGNHVLTIVTGGGIGDGLGKTGGKG